MINLLILIVLTILAIHFIGFIPIMLIAFGILGTFWIIGWWLNRA